MFGNNINITAIVGENGSGKSSILEVIKYEVHSFFSSNNSDIYFGLLYNQVDNSFSLKGNFKNYKLINNQSQKTHELDKRSIENQIVQQNFKINSISTKNIHNIYFTKSPIYYPDMTTETQISEHLANITDEYLYDKFAEDIQSQYKHILRDFSQIKQLYNDNIFQNGLEAFYSDNIKFPKDWKKPNKISISFNHSYVFTSFDSLLQKFKEEKNQTKYDKFIKFKALYNLHDSSGEPHYKRNEWQYFFKYLSILNFITSSYQGIGEEVNGKFIEESIDKIDTNNNNKSIDELINFYSQDFTIDDALYEVPKKYFVKVKEAISTLTKFDTFYNNGMFSITIENNIHDIVELIQLHKHLTVTVSGFLNFRLFPYFSDGHQEFFNLFAKIYMAINTPFDNIKPKENDTILLLLDEVDNYLHPNWQKQFLNIFTNFLSKNYKQYNFQIIITSHSPFILSDLPKENVIFLKNGEQVHPDIDTFGANIHTLLSHGFFMQDGLMGEFAKEKINKAIKYLNQKTLSQEEIAYCEDIISIVGEPILKRQLQKMLDSKRLSEVDQIKKQIKELQEELAKKEDKKYD
ncbi:AAA family ATPase [Sulfurimonas sp.]|uniref:AAA family ATPase n=1 Tax=Sulfurimonas sp. TaxID=2022749 RepID=UPI003D0B8994